VATRGHTRGADNEAAVTRVRACVRTWVRAHLSRARAIIDHGTAMPAAENWPPPGFPLVQGDHALTATWKIHLPEQFARRVAEGSLVLWRPGTTIWLTVWGNDNNETQAQRLASIKEDPSAGRRFAARCGGPKASGRCGIGRKSNGTA
jgi:hypothetical protein